MENKYKMIHVVVVHLILLTYELQACPTGCKCVPRGSNKVHEVAVDCSRLNLTEIPTVNIPINTTVLNMSHNLMTRVKADVFLKSVYPSLSSLNYIYLDNNQITEIEPYAFKDVKIRELLLRDNRIEQLREGTFYSTDGLGLCGPGDNVFSSLTNNVWEVYDLYETRWPCEVDLTKNPIRTIENGTFTGADNITLKLGESEVPMEIAAKSFMRMSGVIGIFITNVTSLKLYDASFELNTIEWFFIDKVHISTLPKYVFGEAKPNWIRFANSKIDRILGLNVVMNVDTVCYVKTYPYQAHVYTSKSTSTIRSGGIEFINNILPVLPTDMIKDSHIAGLLLQGNNIAGFEPYVFARYRKQIVQTYGKDSFCWLKLKDNVFTNITRFSFGKLYRIHHVTLHRNTFDSILDNAFNPSEDIGTLAINFENNANHSSVTINKKAFTNMSNVKMFSLSKSSESGQDTKPKLIVKPYAFDGLKVEYMTVSTYKDMSTYPDNMFTGLTVNQMLTFYAQSLTRIGALAFGGPGQSHIKRISWHYLHNIPCDCETSKLASNIIKNNIMHGITCSGPFSDGSMSHAWPLTHATCVSCRNGACFLLVLVISLCSMFF